MRLTTRYARASSGPRLDPPETKGRVLDAWNVRTARRCRGGKRATARRRHRQHPRVTSLVKIDTAVRLASTTFPHVSVADAATIIRSFLDEVASCAACGPDHKVVWAREVTVTLKPDPQHTDVERTDVIKAGVPVSCPRCGGATDLELIGKDPDYVGMVDGRLRIMLPADTAATLKAMAPKAPSSHTVVLHREAG